MRKPSYTKKLLILTHPKILDIFLSGSPLDVEQILMVIIYDAVGLGRSKTIEVRI